MNTVAIVGVGLIGGSFALALRAAGFEGSVLGVSSPGTVAKALDLRVIDEAVELQEAAGRADLIYLAQPIGGILSTLRSLDTWVRPDALVTDAGSTKAEIVSTAAAHLTRCQFLGGHPVAGKETRGVDAAEATLFRGRPYVLTPVDREDLNGPRPGALLHWIERMGAVPVVMGASDHDRTLAYTSHLPQLVSTALGAVLATQVPDSKCVAGPALSDSLRLALSPFEVWGDIVATNTASIDQALGKMIAELDGIRRSLKTKDLAKVFERAEHFSRSIRKVV